MAHTPGPWRVADGPTKSILARSPSGRPDSYVQVIYHDDENYIYQSPDDANLIAAAPDMLMALLEVSVFAEMQVEDLAAAIQEGEDATIAIMELKRWQSVGDAIRKATGQQS